MLQNTLVHIPEVLVQIKVFYSQLCLEMVRWSNAISITHHNAPVNFAPISLFIPGINHTKKTRDFQAGSGIDNTDMYHNQQLEEWRRGYGIPLVRTNLHSFPLLQ